MAKVKYTKDYFTKEEKELMRRVIDRIWDVIAYDVLVNNDGEPDESVTVPATEVAEYCLDADRWEAYGGTTKEEFRPLIDKLYALDGWDEWKKAVNDILPYKVYGY